MADAIVAAVRARWHNLRYGFIFLPGIVALGFVGLAFLLTWIDSLGGAHGVAGFGGDAPTARSILSTIATALITVSGLTFSITVVSLQLVSQQFSPRALRNFLGDQVTQIVAGSFVGIFAFCLLVLRRVRQGNPGGGPEFVPGLSVTAAIVLGVITLALLLVFIHHMSRSIQLSTIASGIARSALDSLERLYPESFGHAEETSADALVRGWQDEPPRRVLAPRAGYVQTIALDELARRLGGSRARIRVNVAPGDFVTRETVLAEIWANDDDDRTRTVRSSFAIANERDVRQDVGYGIRQLADIAIRALSPGINDPTTARTCIRYLQAILEELSQRDFPPEVRRYAQDEVVVAARRPTFDEYLEPLLEVAWHARDDPRVSIRIADAIRQTTISARHAGATDRVRALDAAAATLVGRT